MEQLQVREIINKNLLRQNNHDPITPEPNGLNLGSKGKLSNAPPLMIVPNHNLIQWVLRLGPSANQRQNITPEKHLDNTDTAAVIELPPENLAERVAVVDSEAAVSAGRKAGEVLVKGQVKESRRRGEGLGKIIIIRVRVVRGGSFGEEGDC